MVKRNQLFTFSFTTIMRHEIALQNKRQSKPDIDPVTDRSMQLPGNKNYRCQNDMDSKKEQKSLLKKSVLTKILIY